MTASVSALVNSGVSFQLEETPFFMQKTVEFHTFAWKLHPKNLRNSLNTCILVYFMKNTFVNS
ncbi:TPA: hypothetical protein DDW35_07590 [Candidatus Sumerlaeota bacterium]|jgi:hypothetical protein|nr:hypothetical protein [Candidatus Sumerlaeota bacterium]